MLVPICLLVRSLVPAHSLHHCLQALLCIAIYLCLSQRYLLALPTDAVPAESVVQKSLLVGQDKGKVQPPLQADRRVGLSALSSGLCVESVRRYVDLSCLASSGSCKLQRLLWMFPQMPFPAVCWPCLLACSMHVAHSLKGGLF